MKQILLAIKAFDTLLGKQIELAACFCKKMAQDPSVTPEEVETLRMAVYVHHLGFLKMKRNVLHRALTAPESLTPQQARHFRHHPIQGAELAQEMGLPHEVCVAIQTHHEHWDGSGYPLGLKGHEISRPARMLAVGSFYAQTPLSPEEAQKVLEAHSGKWFCPESVRLFFKTCAQEGLPPKVRDILAQDADPSMVLASPVYNSTGLLIIPAGQPLGPAAVKTLKNHASESLIDQRIFVYY